MDIVEGTFRTSRELVLMELLAFSRHLEARLNNPFVL
jgi:hypothetical protein